MIKRMLGVALLCGLQSGALVGMDGAGQQGRTVTRSIDTIPAMCCDVMEQLFKQPKSYYHQDRAYQKLVTEHVNDAKICVFLNESHWFKDNGSMFYMRLKLEVHEAFAPSSLCFWVPKEWRPWLDKSSDTSVAEFEKRLERKSQEFLSELELAYKAILEKLKSGWNFVPSGHADSILELAQTLPEGSEVLFVKEKSLDKRRGCVMHKEADLVLCLAEKFGLGGLVGCSDSERCSDETPGKVYLWVKREAFDQFMATFGFRNSKGELLTVS